MRELVIIVEGLQGSQTVASQSTEEANAVGEALFPYLLELECAIQRLDEEVPVRHKSSCGNSVIPFTGGS